MSDPQTTSEKAPKCSDANHRHGDAYPGELCAAERQLRAGLDTGVAVSGGGIRSATFALGVFQAIAKNNQLKKIDYLSTVSGGGYFGSFLTRLFSRTYVKSFEDAEEILQASPDLPKAPAPQLPPAPDKPPTDKRRAVGRVISWLRESGRYMAPRGAGDLLFDAATMFRNWLTITAVMGALVVAAMLVAQLPVVIWRQHPMPAEWLAKLTWITWTRDIWKVLPGESVIWSPWIVGAIVPFGLATAMAWAYWLVPQQSQSTGPARSRMTTAVAAWPGIVPPLALLVGTIPVVARLSGRFVSWMPADGSIQWISAVSVGTVAALAVGFSFAAKYYAATVPLPAAVGAAAAQNAKAFQRVETRYRLSLWLTILLVLSVGILAFGVIDTIAATLYGIDDAWTKPFGFTLPAIFAALSGLGRRLAVLAAPEKSGKRAPLPVSLLAGIAAVILLALLFIGVDIFVQAVAWDFQAPAEHGIRLRNYAAWLVAFTVIAYGFGRARPVVNQSTMLNLYASRLTRAYLGATNPDRWRSGKNTRPMPVIEPALGDDMDLSERRRALDDGDELPIHLVNVTINETYDGHSQVQQRDRKGVGMAIGPCGLSAGVRHHAVQTADTAAGPNDADRLTILPPEGSYRVFEYTEPQRRSDQLPWEPLQLGRWMGISGAAFSTGSGYHTSFGISMLAGLANVRLGYWWDSGVDPKKRTGGSRERLAHSQSKLFASAFRVQSFLLSEYLARFPGTAGQYWYLSDGGHFENMGGYELIRRRLPVVIIVDGEADSDYTFEGLSNLVRKARLDFQTDICFLSEAELTQKLGKPSKDLELGDPSDPVGKQCSGGGQAPGNYRDIFGTLDQLRANAPEKKKDDEEDEIDEAGWFRKSRAHCALARVTYPGDEPGTANWLLYIKTTLTGDEPADVLQYARANQTFPHQSTADQFFDEAQWESYRRLGEHIGSRVFGEGLGTTSQRASGRDNGKDSDWSFLARMDEMEKRKSDGHTAGDFVLRETAAGERHIDLE